jgi:hypothetical protein
MRWTKKYRGHLTKMRLRAWANALSRRKGIALCKRLLDDKKGRHERSVTESVRRVGL